MSQATSSSAAAAAAVDVADIELGATLLLTTSNASSNTTTTTTTTTSKINYPKIWRRTLYIGFFISVKKRTTSSGNHQSPLSSVPYTSSPSARTSPFKSSVTIDIEEEEEEEKEECNSSDVARIVEEEELRSPHDLGRADFVSAVLDGQRPHSEEGLIDDGNTTIPLPVLGTNLSKFLLNSCKCYRCTILMLLVSAGLSFAIEFKKEGPKNGWHDGVAILFALLLLVLGNSVANFLRERKMLKLAKRKRQSEFLVKRGEESLMVTDTSNAERRGLLESLIEKPISYIDMATLFISVLVALVVLIRLICRKDGNNGGLPETKGKVSISLLMEALKRIILRPQGSVTILTGLVTVAILCVQHGMPLVVTISLKYQIDKVVSNTNAVFNDLSACTTMGLVTVICIDASGGLITKPIEVSRIWMGEKYINMVEGSDTDQPVLDMLKQGVGLSVLAPEISLSPLYNSLVSWAETTWEMDIRSFTKKFDILKHNKLNYGKQGSGVLVRKNGDNEVLHLHWSGAASTILEMCTQYHDSKGECHAMENQKIIFGQVIKEMEDDGLKPIAFAYRTTDGEELEQEELILSGLIGLKYTSLEFIKSALENLKNAAKVQIKLVSEDVIMGVEGIACELGLEHGTVLEGKKLQDLNEEARLDEVDRAHVMASFHPEDKLLMIQCLQKKGKVVAFIGTRLMTSHPSVLKVADVGIVHDSLTTEVDTDSCDISIKCFSALKPIVMAGRSKYHNIQKFIQLQLTCTISGSVITLITTCTGDSPLAASQLIWVNVLMGILGGLMMVMKLTSEEQLAKQQSGHRKQHIITKEIWKNIVIQVLYQTSVSMVLEFGGHVAQRDKKVRETMIFNIFVLCQIFNLLNTMQLLKKEVFKEVVQSFCFLGAIGGCFLMQVLVIEYAKGLADCMPLNAVRWGICVLIGALAWVFEWTLNNILPVILNPSTNYASETITSPSFYLSPAFPFLTLLLFPVGLIFSQIGMNMTFR